MFCETCVDLFRTIGEAQAKSRVMNGYKVPGKFTHHSTYDAFQKALFIGCYMCKRLWMYIESLCNDPDFVAKGFAAFESFCRWSMKYPEVKIVLEFPKTINVYEAVSIVPVGPSKDRVLLPGYHETTNTGSDACFTLADNWLETCLSSHRSCKRYRPSVLKEWTPNHLICVKNVDAIVLCLHETGNISLGVKYATLSHCWGKIPDAQRLLFMRDNIDSWTRGMPDLQSMKTFDHAITICQKLGLDYIWIDSLCIIQDSQDDWHQRASLMDRVYKYSQCTITATAAENDTVGCFFDRDVNICLPSRVKFVQKSTYLPDATKGPTSESTYRPEGSKPMDLTCIYELNGLCTWYDDVTNAPVKVALGFFRSVILVHESSISQIDSSSGNVQSYKPQSRIHMECPRMKKEILKPEVPFITKANIQLDINFEAENLSQKRRRLDTAFLIWNEAVFTY